MKKRQELTTTRTRFLATPFLKKMLTQLSGADCGPPMLGVQLPQSPPPEIDNQFEEAGGQSPDTATKHTLTDSHHFVLL